MINEFLQLLDKYSEGLIHILPKLAFALAIVIVFYFVAKKFGRFLRKRVTKRVEDTLFANFAAKIAASIIFVIGLVLAMEILGLSGFTGGLIAGAGGSALILGFAFKDIGENFLSGVILAFNKPFKVGDMVEIENISGRVITLDLRSTIVRTFEGYDVFIPNSMLIKNPLINYHRQGLRRFDFKVGIDYKDDYEKAKELILTEIVKIKEILRDPPPMVVISDLTSNSIMLATYYWIDATSTIRNHFEIRSEAFEMTLRVFKEGGVSIPNDSIQIDFNKGIPVIPVNITEKKET